MATVQVNGSAVTATSTVNRGGVAKKAGSSSTVLENVALGDQGVSVSGSTVIDGTDTDKAVSAGTFKYDNQRPIAKRVTTSLATVSNTVLRSGALVPSHLRLLHKRESYKVNKIATAIRAGYWNIYSGTWTTNPTSTTESPGTDEAATPTRSVPGELVYKTGAKVPVQDNYKAKTG